MNKTIQKGFTLIELMIVVAIIAILAAIAIPQYQNYIARAQISRAVGETGSLKTAVEDCYTQSESACPNAQIASDLTTTPLKIGAGVTMGADGAATIIMTLDGNASSLVKNGTVTWTRTADAADGTGDVWSCKTAALTGPVSLAPKSCPAS